VHLDSALFIIRPSPSQAEIATPIPKEAPVVPIAATGA
jgi:hypothetical protein